MRRAYIICDSHPEGRSRVPIDRPIVVGRTPDCDLIIADAGASRHHMEVSPRSGSYFWRDMNSTNGVLINGERQPEGELHDGDWIRIGSTDLRFELAQESNETTNADTQLFRSTILDRAGEQSADLGNTGELLQAAFAVMNDIASNYDRCDLVDRILETTLKAINAQRGAVFFAEDGDGRLGPCPVCGSVHLIEKGVLKHTDRHRITISRTIAERVLEAGESILIKDTEDFEDFGSTDSVLALNLRSIICVPVRGKFGILGILYIDTDNPDQQYTHQHMLLSTAVGNSAGLALENAALHRQILEHQLIHQEIEYAATIQEGFLAKHWPINEPRFQVYGETKPAKRVGGDFYDYIQPDDKHVGLLIGDVSGKGVPAALTMAQLLTEFRMYGMQMLSPLDVVNRLNATLVEKGQRGMFCTLCYVLVNLKTGSTRIVNAGHHPVLRITSSAARETGDPTGPPIGIVTDAAWRVTEEALAPGDALVLYTDGLTEARAEAPAGTPRRLVPEYGAESIRRVMRRMRSEPCELAVRALLEDVKRFSAPSTPHDDCTVIAFKYGERKVTV